MLKLFGLGYESGYQPPISQSPIPQLPRELWCQIAQETTTLTAIRGLLRSHPQWILLIPACVRKITKDPSQSNEIIPAKFILGIRNIEEVEVPIRVNTREELLGLARLKKLKIYNLRLSPFLNSGYSEEDYRNFTGLIADFFSAWVESGKRVLPRTINISREGDPGILRSVLNVILRRRIEFNYNAETLILYFFYLLPTVLPNLIRILKYLENLQAIRRIIINPEVIPSEIPAPPVVHQFTFILDDIPSITEITVNGIIGIPLLYILVIVVSNPSIKRLTMTIGSLPETLQRLQFNKNSQDLSTFFEYLISKGFRSYKPVELQLPFNPSTIPIILQVFPEVKRIGIWDESVPPGELDSILNDLLSRYPDINFNLVTFKPKSTYVRITDLSGDRIRVNYL